MANLALPVVGVPAILVDSFGNPLSSFLSQLTNGGGSVTVNADGSVGITALASGVTITGNLTVSGTISGTVTAAAGTLTGTTLAANVVNSSLTTVGILASPHLTSPTVDSGGLTVTTGGLTVTGNSTIAGTLGSLTGLTVVSGGASITGGLTIGDAVGQIIPGATSISLRNHANSADNLIVTDAGGVTIRAGLTITASGLTVSAGGITVTGGITGAGGAGWGMTAKMTKYNNVNTTGWGLPAVYAQARVATQTNTTVTLTSYAVPAAANGVFLVSCHLEVTAAATAAMTVSCTYTDVNGNAVTLTMPLIKDGTAGFLASGSIVAVGTYSCPAVQITAKLSTTITLQTAGTVTGITYTADGSIIQIG